MLVDNGSYGSDTHNSRGDELMVLSMEALARRAPSNESARSAKITQVCHSKGPPTLFSVHASNP
jgi:hypothetical protein